MCIAGGRLASTQTSAASDGVADCGTPLLAATKPPFALLTVCAWLPSLQPASCVAAQSSLQQVE